jgi:general secretion pathway protein K
MMTSPLHLVGPQYTGNNVVLEPLVEDFKGSVTKDGAISVSVQDLSGLVSLFPFDEKNFYRLLIENGYSDEMVVSFKDELADWQDGDSLTRLEGKEHGDYAEYPFFPSNMILQTVDELAYLLEPIVFENIKPWIALYGQGNINRQFTPEALYSAVGIKVNNNKEYTLSVGDGEGGYIYPSGRYLVTLSFAGNDVSLNKQFLLIRGLETFQPFFVVNEKLF